jgi:hypothetical protein
LASIVPLSPVTICLEQWKFELESDPDYDFITEGIQNGFNIIDTELRIDSCLCDNYKSTQSENKQLVEDQINKEILKGRYTITDTEPHVVSALGAIPKSATKIRLIHDLSRPGGGVNRLAEDTAVVYPTIDEATRSMTSKTFLAKIDLSEAYRSIPIHKSNFELTGLHWHFADSSTPTYFFDARLPFGGKSELVRSWLSKTKVTKKCVQKLVGKLNWCCRVVQGGRTFMRNLINLISKASQPHHYVRVGKAAKADLVWWDKGLRLFHGYTPFPADIPLPSTSF